MQQGFPTPGNPRYVGNPDQREASLAKCLLVRFLFRYLINPALGLHLQDWDAHSIGAKKLKMFIGEFVHDTQQVFPTPGNPRYAKSLGQKEASLAECLLHRPLFSDTYLSSFPALQGWDVHLIGAKKLKIFVDDFVYDTQIFILSLLSDMLEVRLTNHQVYLFTQFNNTDVQIIQLKSKKTTYV